MKSLSPFFQWIPRAARSALQLLLLVGFVFATSVVFSAGRAQAAPSCPTVDVYEAWVSVYRIYLNGVENGYGIDMGFELDETNAVSIVTDGAKVAPPGKTAITLEEDFGEYEYFDGDTFDPDLQTGTAFASQAALEALYPPGTYTFTMQTACDIQTFTGSFDFDNLVPDGGVHTIYPAHNENINHNQPVIITQNACSNCNKVETELYSASSEAVELEYWPSADLTGTSPNALPYSEFFGSNGYGNQGGGGDVIDLTSFTVLAQVATSADVYDAEISINELLALPSDGLDGISVGFGLDAEVDGTNLNDVSLYIPNLGKIDLVETFDGEFNYDTRDSIDAPERSDITDLFPATDAHSRYVFMVDGGRSYALVKFDPQTPGGTFLMDAPADGATTTQFPEFTATSSCGTCDSLSIWVEDILTDGDEIDIGWMEFANPAPPATGGNTLSPMLTSTRSIRSHWIQVCPMGTTWPSRRREMRFRI